MSSVSTDRLQGVNVGAAVKVPCRLATTSNITLSGLQTIDGVVTAQDDRVLVKNQTTSSQNGIYLADSGAWERDKDWDGSFDVKKGTVVHVTEGSTYTRTWWEVTTSDPITPGTTGVTIIQGIADAVNVSFLPSGTGAVAEPLQTLGLRMVWANQYTGADIFAQANTAAASFTAPGIVWIAPGTYTGVTTTLNCLDNIVFMAYGVTINWSGVTGSAVRCKNVSHSGLKGCKLLGTGTAGTNGLYAGATTADPATTTVYNCFEDIQIGSAGVSNSGFAVNIKLDGATGKGTYTNTFKHVVSLQATSQNWLIKPTNSNFCNANNFLACDGEGATGDNWQIDGASGNWFTGCRAETGGAFGFNLAGTLQTYGNIWLGGWSESNTSGDFNFGSAANVTYTQVLGPVMSSTPNVAGSPSGQGNIIIPSLSAGRFIDWYGGTINHHMTSAVGVAFAFALANDESPASGITNVFGLNRTGANAGNLYMGTPEYPATARGRILEQQGAAVASANDLTLGTDGNRFQISGTTQINRIDSTGVQGGTTFTLHFQSTPTVKHGQATGGAFKIIRLAGSADFVAAPNGRLTIQYDSTDVAWYEIARTVA